MSAPTDPNLSPYTPAVHNEQRINAQVGLPQDTQTGMRGKFVESILRLVVQAITGVFVPGGLGSAFDQLKSWAEEVGDAIANIPIFGPIIEWLASLFGIDIGDVGNPSFDPGDIWSGVTSAFINPLGFFANLIGGLVPGIQIPGLDASKIISGSLPQAIVGGLTGALNTLTGGLQGAVDGIVNSLRGFAGSFWSQGDANDALSAQAKATAETAAALAQIQAGQNQGNNGGLNVIIDFSTFPDSAHLPSIFTETYVGGTKGSYGVASGLARATSNADFFEERTIFGEYNVADTMTDYQRISGVWTGSPAYSYQNPTPFFTPSPWYNAYYALHALYCRWKDVNNWVRVQFKPGGTGITAQAFLECCVAGTITTFATVSHTFQPNTAYVLEAGSVGGLRTFRVLAGTKPILTYTDSAAVSQVGASFRGGGLGGRMEGAQGAGVTANPAPILYFGMQDNSPASVIGSGARFYRASTGSASVTSIVPNSFFDTIEYQTDEYTYDPLNNCRITVAKTDWYVVTVKLRFSATSTPSAQLLRNGSAVRAAGGSANIPATLGSWVVYLQAGDYINAGLSSTQSCVGSADGTASAIEITRVGKAT